MKPHNIAFCAALLSQAASIPVLASPLGSAAPAVSQPVGSFSELAKAYKNGDYKLEMRLALPLANQGDSRAQRMLADIYDRGFGVDVSLTDAVKWYKLAAKGGDAEAQAMLGQMFDQGLGVRQDYAEAARWYRLAAVQGQADAQEALGVLYFTGDGVAKDDVLALMWLDLSAAEDGQDSTRATRDGIAKEISSLKIAEAEKLAREWKLARPVSDERHGKPQKASVREKPFSP